MSHYILSASVLKRTYTHTQLLTMIELISTKYFHALNHNISKDYLCVPVSVHVSNPKVFFFFFNPRNT